MRLPLRRRARLVLRDSASGAVLTDITLAPGTTVTVELPPGSQLAGVKLA